MGSNPAGRTTCLPLKSSDCKTHTASRQEEVFSAKMTSPEAQHGDHYLNIVTKTFSAVSSVPFNVSEGCASLKVPDKVIDLPSTVT